MRDTQGDKIDALCAEFCENWRASDPNLIEDYLDRVGDFSRDELFRKLLTAELQLRQQIGHVVDPNEYERRFLPYLPIVNELFPMSKTAVAARDSVEEKGQDILVPTVPGFRVLKVLGTGGMGLVYHAIETQLERDVALKMMRPEVAMRPEARERFLREARIAAKLEHQHIVTVHHVDEHDGVPYLIMPLLTGETVEDRLKRENRLSVEETIGLCRQITKGLSAAHKTGLIHRDIKPSNIWLHATDDGVEVKLLDFGLARPLESDEHITHTGVILGTPGYMAPEQAETSHLDHRCDLFSLGCVLYRMVTGVPPFPGKHLLSVLRETAERDPPRPETYCSHIPSALSSLIMHLLQKEPNRRPDSAQVVLELLDVIERGVGETHPSTTDTSESLPAVPTPSQPELFRIERPSLPDEPDFPLYLDLGFFRAKLKAVSDPTKPIFCGCACVRLLVRLKDGESLKDPTFPALPDDIEAKVEYGIGTKPSLRFEAVGKPQMLEGRVRVAFSLTRSSDELKLAVQLEPQWFTVEGPAGQGVDSANQVIVDAILRKLTAAVTRKFKLGERQ